MRECNRQGCRVFLLTAEKLRDADWPRECLTDIFYLPKDLPLADILKAVSHLARNHKIDRVVALDEYDMETASALREHLRLPGMGMTTMRYFRDKLAMRMRALERDILMPDFVPVINHGDIRYYLGHVSGPWVLKPRSEASAIGIRLIENPEQLWPILDELADEQSSYVLERFTPGQVYHVDSIVYGHEVRFETVSRYGKPPMSVAHHGGVFTTALVPRDGDEWTRLAQTNRELITALGLAYGVSHAEFIRAEADGEFYFLECAARVGGAYISEMVEAASGINLWREWARIEIAAGRTDYGVPETRADYSAVVLCLAKQDHPDTGAFADPEIVYRIVKNHHAGFVLRSKDYSRIQSLIDEYAVRFVNDFLAIEKPADKPTS